jgi:homoserine kinase
MMSIARLHGMGANISLSNSQHDPTCVCSQGLPLGSGLGSSAASAAAAAWAVNGLFGSPISKADLIMAGLASEAAVSGYHADNVGPSLLGGFVLIRCVHLGVCVFVFASREGSGKCVEVSSRDYSQIYQQAYCSSGACMCVRGWVCMNA